MPLFRGKRISLQKRTIMNTPSTHQDYQMEFVVFAAVDDQKENSLFL